MIIFLRNLTKNWLILQPKVRWRRQDGLPLPISRESLSGNGLKGTKYGLINQLVLKSHKIRVKLNENVKEIKYIEYL